MKKLLKKLLVTSSMGITAIGGYAGLSMQAHAQTQDSVLPQYANMAKLYPDFWKSFSNDAGQRKTEIINTDYSKYPNMGIGYDDSNQAEYGGYMGIAGDDDNQQDIAETIQNSSFQTPVFAFNDERVSNPAFGDKNTYAIMENEGGMTGMGYIDQFGEANDAGGTVDLGFGGDTGWAQGDIDTYFTRIGNAAAGARMLEDYIIANGSHVLDYDIESGDEAYQSLSQVDRLLAQIAAVQSDLKDRFNYNVSARFTVMDWDDRYLTESEKFGVTGTTMDPMLQGHGYTLSDLKSETQDEIANLRKESTVYNKMTDFQIMHHLGFTGTWGQDGMDNDQDAQAIGSWAASSGLGYIGNWAESGDHKQGSKSDPDQGHQSSQNKVDYEFAQDMTTSYLANAEWVAPTAKPDSIKSVNVNYVTQSSASISWDAVPQAHYYWVEDATGKKLYETTKTNFAFNDITAEISGVNIKPNTNYTFKVVAGNSKGEAIGTTVTFNTNDKTLLAQTPLNWNANISYMNRKNWTYQGQIFAYNGKFYQLLGDDKSGAATPDKNPLYKDLGTVTGLSKQYLAQLAKEQNNNVDDLSKDFISQTFNDGTTITAGDLPNVNAFLYQRLAK